MRVLGLDIGERTIGVAVSDPLEITARGVTVIRRRGGRHDLDALARVAREVEAERIVYGLPLGADGEEGASARRARAFAERAGEHLGLPVEPYDESHSTVEAERVLIEGGVSRKKRKKIIDRQAAVVILQSYLSARAQPASPSGEEVP